MFNILSKNREVILIRTKDYYEIDKESLREQERDKYINLSEQEKNKKREYGKNRCRNMSEEKKKRLKEYQKSYREARRSLNIIMNKIFFLIVIVTVILIVIQIT